MKAVIGRYLSALSRERDELLKIASVAGRSFSADLLGEVARQQADQTFELLAEAESARVVDPGERPGAFEFHHALIRRTLLDEVPTSRRIILHGRIGEALDRRYGDDPGRASEIAYHLGEAAALSADAAERAVRKLEEAGAIAETQYAWTEAFRHYEAAVGIIADTGAAPDREAEIQLAIGHSARLAADFRTSWGALMRAIDLHRQREDGTAVARAVLEALRMIPSPARQRVLIEEALEALRGADPEFEAQLLARRASHPDREAEAAAMRGLELARATGCGKAEGFVLSHRILPAAIDAMDLDEAHRVGERAIDLLLGAGELNAAAYSAQQLADLSAWTSRNEDGWARHDEIARRGDVVLRMEIGQFARAYYALLRGDLRAAEEQLAAMSSATFFTAVLQAALAYVSGDLDRAQEAMPAADAAT